MGFEPAIEFELMNEFHNRLVDFMRREIINAA